MNGNRAVRALRCTAAPSTQFALAFRTYPAGAPFGPNNPDYCCHGASSAPPRRLRVATVLAAPYARTAWTRRTGDFCPYRGISADSETSVRRGAKADSRCTTTNCSQRRGSSPRRGLDTRSSEPSGKTRSRVVSPTELIKIAKDAEQGGES